MSRSPSPPPARPDLQRSRHAAQGSPELRSIPWSYALWCFSLFGICGLQRFYNRKPLSGLLWLLTFGLCWIGQLIDLFLIPQMVAQANHPPAGGGLLGGG